MLLAIDDSGNRISPFKGGVAKCSICNSKVIAVCGIINIHHWRHEINPNCDPWQEHETEWHRSWKNEFPKDWQEIVIKENEETHRADVKTPNGLVLELQNSSILAPIIQEREAFYKNMIWLINADVFKDNFEIKSQVNSQLRVNENKYKMESYSISNDWYLKELLSDLKEYEEAEKKYNENLEKTEFKKTTIKSQIENIDKEIEQMLKGSYYSHYYFTSDNVVLTDIKINRRKELEIINKNEEVKRSIKRIESLNTSDILGYETYRFIDFKQLDSIHYKRCKIISVLSLNSMFPEVNNINSESQYLAYSNNNNYKLLINLETELTNYNNSIKENDVQFLTIETERKELIATLKDNFNNWLLVKLDEVDEEIYKYEALLNDAINRKDTLLTQISFHESDIEERHDEENAEKEKEKQKRKSEIMKKYKGIYNYEWKHKRKSWDYSKSELFLDFGTHIFQIKSDTTLVKISKIEFIEMVKNWSR